MAEKLENFEVKFEGILDDVLGSVSEKWDQYLEYPFDTEWEVVDK